MTARANRWSVTVVVPSRENNDGTVTPATYYQGERIERRLVGMKQVQAVTIKSNKRAK